MRLGTFVAADTVTVGGSQAVGIDLLVGGFAVVAQTHGAQRKVVVVAQTMGPLPMASILAAVVVGADQILAAAVSDQKLLLEEYWQLLAEDWQTDYYLPEKEESEPKK